MFWWTLNTYLLQNTVFSLQSVGKDCWHLCSEFTSMWWPWGLTALMLSENISRAFAPGVVQEKRQGADLHITFLISHPSNCPAWILPCSHRVTACTLPGHTATNAADFAPAKTVPSPCCRMCWCLKARTSLGKFGRHPQQSWQPPPQGNKKFGSASPSHCFWETHRKKFNRKKVSNPKNKDIWALGL